MAKFRVSSMVTISIYTDVEAETEEEAIDAASERPMMALCHQCSGGGESRECWVTSGELDGEADLEAAYAEPL
jgi:hypothetical protein